MASKATSKAAGCADATSTSMADPFARLKEPFPEEQTKLGEVHASGFRGTIVEWNYICDRIEEVDPRWEHRIECRYHGPIGNKMVIEVTAHLSILGVSRMGHSAGAVTADGLGDAAKRIETDALKRAASKFGVARYLYAKGKEEPRFKLTPEQVAAVQEAAGKVLKVGDSFSEWASGILGRETGYLEDGLFTASELDILLAVGGK